jgi:phage-related protein
MVDRRKGSGPGTHAGFGIPSSGDARPDKPIAWLHGEVKTPPMSRDARIEAGTLLRRLQRGETLSMPESRPMPIIGPRCYELRIDDLHHKVEWRVMYFTGRLAVVVLDVFRHDSRTTPDRVIAACKRRVADYLRLEKGL